MPAYQSKYGDVSNNVRIIGKVPLLPLKVSPTNKAKSVAPPTNEPEDIIDETLSTFKANIFFRNFKFESPADILLAYLTLYTTQCLGLIRGKNKSAAAKELFTLSVSNFLIPGDGGFVLGGHVAAPSSRADGDLLRQYLTQVRQELGLRLLDKVFANNENQADKWWICFSKRKFLDKSL
eukprot:TRINITY_DN1084_c0_g1_i3.p1 TRINITY_DN1084_c0_g1~~TRINITY_DN1084_c0_g1_i3.p1  ORF type:complete len:179 (-),score=14.60 TRINITY_DN1084_c0_g1_i3:160-696(-)